MLDRLRMSLSLPIHPTLTHPDGRPVRALGVNRRGGLIWPVRGGAEGDEDQGDNSDDSGDDGDQGDDAPAEDTAEKDWKAEFEKQQRINRDLERKVKRDYAKAKADALADLKAKQPKGSDAETDLDAVRAEAVAEVEAKYQRQIVELTLARTIQDAARAFQDPSDAEALLLRGRDVSDFLDADGKVDAEAVEDAINALLEKKPHLAAQGGKRFKGGGDGGARKEQKPKAATLQDAVAARIAAGKT